MSREGIGLFLAPLTGSLSNLVLGALSISVRRSAPSVDQVAGHFALLAAWWLALVVVAGLLITWRSSSAVATLQRGVWINGLLCLSLIPLAQPAIDHVVAYGQIFSEHQAVQFIPFAESIASNAVRGAAVFGAIICACILISVRMAMRTQAGATSTRSSRTA